MTTGRAEQEPDVFQIQREFGPEEGQAFVAFLAAEVNEEKEKLAAKKAGEQ